MSQNVTPEMRAHYRRAVLRAGEVLKKGDRVRMLAHASARPVTYTFEKWDSSQLGFFVSKSGVDELHPYNVVAVNGERMTFRDQGGTEVYGS